MISSTGPRETIADAAAPADAPWVRWLVRVAITVGLVSFCAQLFEIPWRSALRGYDNTFNYLWLRSLMIDGDWDFTNDIEIANTLTEDDRVDARDLTRPPTGLLPNKYGVGWALLSVPGFLVGDAIVVASRAFGFSTLERDGFNAVYQITLHLWHGLLAIVSLLLARRVVAHFTTEPWATVGVLVVWLASPLVYYQTANLGMSHHAAFFAIALAAYGLVQGLARPGARWPWLLAGVGFGLAAITRFQTLVFGLLAVWAITTRVRQHGWRGLGAALWIALGMLPLLILQGLAWRIVYGDWLVFSYGLEHEKFYWAKPQLWNVLFSSWHGLFYWHPLLLVGLAGLAWTAARNTAALALLGCVLATIYVNAAWWCWWFASAFGNRAFDAALLALMAGLAVLFARTRGRWRRALWIVSVVLIAWNVYLLVLYRAAAISRSDPVTWSEMLRAGTRLPSQLRFEAGGDGI